MRKPVPVVASPAANRERLAGMAKVAQSFRGFRPAVEVVRRIVAVPTMFPDLDRVLGVGGFPTDRVIVIHGPSSKGKTSLSLGLGLSFLRLDHFFGLVDAEQTTPVEWLTDMYGEAFNHPGFMALPVGTFEQVRAGVADMFTGIAAARARGDVPPETRALCLVDSVKKLVPKAIWDELQKAAAADGAEAKTIRGGRKQKAKTGVDGVSGRAGQLKAAFLSAWLDELVPLLAQTQGTIVLIAREHVATEGAGQYEREVVTLGGGDAINFDASLRLRVNAFPMYEGAEGSKQYVGEKHTVDILKTKIHAREERVPQAVFHTSNGVASPAGFDYARDLLACSLELGVVELSGSHYKWAGGRLGQGADAALEGLRKHPVNAQALEAACRAKMVKDASPSA